MLGTRMCAIEAFSSWPFIDQSILRKIDLHLRCYNNLNVLVLHQLIRRIHYQIKTLNVSHYIRPTRQEFAVLCFRAMTINLILTLFASIQKCGCYQLFSHFPF